MAKRVRDYKAEEARRNQLAKERGFTTRAAERGAKSRSDYAKAGFSSHADYVKARAAAQEKSRHLSKSPVSAFSPAMGPQRFELYNSAFGFGTFGSKGEFKRHLAGYMHSLDPERWPEYEGNEKFWNDY